MLSTAALTASLPYARMALGAFVAAGAWCAGQYVTARIIRRMDPRAFGDGQPAAPMSKAERIRQIQLMLLTTAAGEAGSMAAAMQDPDTLAALRAMDRVADKTAPIPANNQAAAAKAAA